MVSAAWAGRRGDEADRFVHHAVRAFAFDQECPAPPGDVVWVERARSAGVLSPVLFGLLQAGHAPPEGLQGHRLQVVGRHLRTMADVAELGRVLTGAGVDWAVLKGPVLSAVVFRAHVVRDYNDLDVLVSPSQVRSAVAALLASGATLRPEDWDEANRIRAAEIGLVLPNGTVLDLHWNLVNIGRARDSFRTSTAALLAKRVDRVVDGRKMTTLSDVDVLLHVVLHACLAGGSSLRWVLDAQQCVQWLRADPAVDPAEVFHRANELGVGVPARVMLDRVVQHLDPNLRDWVGAALAPTPWTRFLARVSTRFPPSNPSGATHSGRTLYASTRTDTVTSLRATARVAAARRRAVSAPGRPCPSTLVPTTSVQPAFETWLSSAEREGG